VFDTSAGAGGEPLRLHAFLHGEEFDAARHRPGTLVKAATLHRVSVDRVVDGFEARVVLDV
jgi:SHS2 domain-containing protein